jgi:hypothetical protein
MELSTTSRDLIASFLAGPSSRTIALGSRIMENAIEEAREKRRVLLVTLTRKRSTGGGFGRVLGEAAVLPHGICPMAERRRLRRREPRWSLVPPR